jgi:hypothetical protein
MLSIKSKTISDYLRKECEDCEITVALFNHKSSTNGNEHNHNHYVLSCTATIIE